jgi:hypothetical protein
VIVNFRSYCEIASLDLNEVPMLDVDFSLRSDRTMKALSKQMQSRRLDRQRKPGGGGKYRLDRVEAKLFFILM